MALTSKKLSLDDLSIGMTVTSSQLSDILDTYIKRCTVSKKLFRCRHFRRYY